MQPNNQPGSQFPLGQPGQAPVPGQQPPGFPQQSGSVQPKRHSHVSLIVTIVLLTLLFLGAIGFGLWAFSERTTYKTQTDEIVAREVQLAVEEAKTEKDNEFEEKEKFPLKEYLSPAQFGSIKIMYPKTWSAFVTESDSGNSLVNGYFHPNFVPGTNSGTAYALRLEVVDKSYSQEVKTFDNKIERGELKAVPFSAKNVPEVLGLRVEGEINKGQEVVMVLLPVRDKTLKLSTQARTFFDEFDEIILPDLEFTP